MIGAPLGLLIADLAALLLAPALDWLVQSRPAAGVFVAVLARAAVAGIVAVHLLPHGVEVLGPAAIALLLAGLGGAMLWERSAHRVSLAGGAAAALIVHHLVDGIAIATGPELGIAVVLHTAPVGIVAWRLGAERGGAGAGAALLAAVAAATVTGFGAGRLGLGEAATPIATGVACALGGSLLHALGHASPPEGTGRAAAAGAAAGLGLIALLVALDPPEAGGLVVGIAAGLAIGGVGLGRALARGAATRT